MGFDIFHILNILVAGSAIAIFRSVEGRPLNSRENEIEESWKWLSGELACLITGVLIEVIAIQLFRAYWILTDEFAEGDDDE